MRGRHILGLAWPGAVTVSILINGVSEDNERSIITINLHSTYPPRIQPIPIPISNEDPAQPRWSLIFRLFGTTAGLIYQIKCHKIRRNLIICISLLPHSSKGWGYTASCFSSIWYFISPKVLKCWWWGLGPPGVLFKTAIERGFYMIHINCKLGIYSNSKWILRLKDTIFRKVTYQRTHPFFNIM